MIVFQCMHDPGAWHEKSLQRILSSIHMTSQFLTQFYVCGRNPPYIFWIYWRVNAFCPCRSQNKSWSQHAIDGQYLNCWRHIVVFTDCLVTAWFGIKWLGWFLQQRALSVLTWVYRILVSYNSRIYLRLVFPLLLSAREVAWHRQHGYQNTMCTELGISTDGAVFRCFGLRRRSAHWCLLYWWYERFLRMCSQRSTPCRTVPGKHEM